MTISGDGFKVINTSICARYRVGMDWALLLVLFALLIAPLFVGLRGLPPNAPRHLIIRALADYVVGVVQAVAAAVVLVLTAPWEELRRNVKRSVLPPGRGVHDQPDGETDRRDEDYEDQS
ncbi:hypothetical protein ACFQ1S_06440 [Kibdelosporangium lantanae]|uniref:Uncharacterized protein n=1 Tax=Kibdelosporangium lantanae TaxID=1497396 RepID=A0ABW3M3L1_9PSEU